MFTVRFEENINYIEDAEIDEGSDSHNPPVKVEPTEDYFESLISDDEITCVFDRKDSKGKYELC